MMGSIKSLKPLDGSKLFEPLELGALKLEHRVVLAPLTRMRASKESDGVWVCNDMNVEHYSQRASKGGFLLTEACPISRRVCDQIPYFQSTCVLTSAQAAGYPGVPGIFTESQIAAWKKVTNAVHAKGAYIYCQLWHVGRATVPALIEGLQALSSSDIPISGKALNGQEYSNTPPKPMSVEEIEAEVEEYVSASKRAMEAGFDGVEIHSSVV